VPAVGLERVSSGYLTPGSASADARIENVIHVGEMRDLVDEFVDLEGR
jgi:hypothetical protein